MVKLKKAGKYDIQPIKGESYHDCKFPFGRPYYHIAEFDEDGCFRKAGEKTWWDCEGFKITFIE